MTVYCRKAVAYQSPYCAFHRNKRMTVIEGTQPKEIEKVKDIPEREPIWIHENTVLNAQGDTIGLLQREKQKITWFILPE